MTEPAYKVTRDGRMVCALNTKDGKQIYLLLVALMWLRQGKRCCLCYRPIRLDQATFEHEHGRGMSGGHRNDAIEMPDGAWINGAACYRCNSAKGSQRIAYNIR